MSSESDYLFKELDEAIKDLNRNTLLLRSCTKKQRDKYLDAIQRDSTDIIQRDIDELRRILAGG